MITVPRFLRRTPLATSLLLLGTAGGVVSCTSASDSESVANAPEVIELQGPAGAGSGQPYVETTERGVVLAWTEPGPDGTHQLLTSRLGNEGFETPVQLVQRDSLFVNWADFPMISRTPDGVLSAHWLVRYPSGGTAYRIEVVQSRDGGRTWSEPWTPHEDGTETEHGFLSFVTMPDGGTGMAWLDGRKYAGLEAGADGHGPPEGEMTLRFRSIGPDGVPSGEVLLDDRTCDCCQTAATSTSEGPIVAYRDRSPDEIRDISIVRWRREGWSEPRPVHRDGWEIHGCPVNGPALDAREARVAIAWFTAPEGLARVKVAFSDDAGRTFAPPITIDDGRPEGRVDLVLDDTGAAWVAWLERTQDGADVRLRRVHADGTVEPYVTVAASSEQRASGFPRMAHHPAGGLILAWTDPSEDGRVRVARVGIGK